MHWRTACRVAAPPRSGEMKHHHAHTSAGHSPLKSRSRNVGRTARSTAGATLCRRVAHGAVLSLNFRSGGSGAATGQSGSARHAAEAVFAALRLPCAARVRGPVAQLAALTAFAALGQARRVSSRGGLRARATHPVLLGASHARRALPGCPVAEPMVARVTSNGDPIACRVARADACARRRTHADSRNGPRTGFQNGKGVGRTLMCASSRRRNAVR
jgi:hypothetical protein